MTMYDMQIIMT